jgi:transcription initiation factor TFIID subunit 6
MASLWNPDNIKDVGESVGLGNLGKEVVDHLARDVDYRLAQVLEHALKFMRHSRRTTLHTEDISKALSALDIEPLFGYESTRPLRFGEAPTGGQPIYYLEDDEIDFEKLINAPLPKVPREISFTAHWLAIEGVQPSIAQNPTSTDSRHQELLPKGPNANPNLAAVSGQDSVSVKPLVKHILSSEIQLYFERITTAILEDSNEETRNAAFNSVRTDPGLHQLVPYFIQFVADKVTHHTKDLFILTQMLHLSHALLQNKSLFIEPYIGSLVPSVLTCLTSKQIGTPNDLIQSVFAVRDLAASLIVDIARKHSKSSTTLKPRLARTLLKAFLDPNRTFGAHYGALMGLQGLIGTEGIRVAILPNIKAYDSILSEGLADDSKTGEAKMVVLAILRLIDLCARDAPPTMLVNGITNGNNLDVQPALEAKVGSIIGAKVAQSGDIRMIKLVQQVEPVDI